MPRTTLCLAAAVVGALLVSSPAGARAGCPWMNQAMRPTARAAALLTAMSSSDKLALLSGVDPTAALKATDGPVYVGYVPGNPQLCLPALTLNDGSAGIGNGQTGVTAFPAPISQAATWDTALQRTFGRTLGLQAWQKGIDVLLAPDVNIARVPENGRNFEAYGEDPFLSGQTAAAVIDGIQQNPVIATVKHFSVNSQETNRYYLTSNVDDRTLHEIYLPPFEAAVQQGHVGAVMCAYGQVKSVFACQDPKLLTTVLRDEMRFRGFVVSDWGATWSTVASANAGLDLEMPGGKYFAAALANAVAAGTVTTATIDRMARTILTSMFRLGVFDDPPPARDHAYLSSVSSPAARHVALRLAEEGTVLLKNDAGTLPLHPASGKTIALIGSAAAAADVPQYTGSSYVIPTDPVSPLQALTARAAKAGDSVSFASGTDPAAAAALAARSSVAIVFAYDLEHEGDDRPGLELPVGQDALIEQVARANPHTVVVLDTGGPVLMPWLDQVAAVVEAWYPGERAGDAISAVLYGDVNPSGRLPQTFPASDTAVPTSLPGQWPGSGEAQDAAFSERLDVGYRWYDAQKVTPLFPFGYGLSYTSFDYSHLRVRRSATGVSVSFTVRNVGTRRGTEVVQLYVDDPRKAGEPPKQLKAYDRVGLRPGQSRTVTLGLSSRAFAVWDPGGERWLVRHGLYRILVGASSRDIRLHGFVRMG